MITISLILAALLIGYFGITFLSAGSSKDPDQTKSKLSEILDGLFFSIPLDKLMSNEKESLISVNFTVNEYYELAELKIKGENEKLVKYAQNKLSHEITKFIEEIGPSKFNVKLKFVLK